MDHIRKIVQLSGNPVWQVNGRKFGFGRPQFATKELAEVELADMIKKRGGGLSPGRRDVTFAEQAETFLANAADGLAEKTLRSYRGHLNVHILQYLGKRRVVEINAPMIKTFLIEKRQPILTVKIVSAKPKKPRVIDLANFDSTTMKRWPEQDADATRKLSISTLRLIRATLSVVFASAVDDRIIDRNPVPDAKVSRHSRKAKAANRVAVPKERVFTETQQAALLSWSSERDPELHDVIFLLLRSGLRPGECRALAWSDLISRGEKFESNIRRATRERSAQQKPVWDAASISARRSGTSCAYECSSARRELMWIEARAKWSWYSRIPQGLRSTIPDCESASIWRWGRRGLPGTSFTTRDTLMLPRSWRVAEISFTLQRNWGTPVRRPRSITMPTFCRASIKAMPICWTNPKRIGSDLAVARTNRVPRLKNLLNLFDFLEPPVGFEPTTC